MGGEATLQVHNDPLVPEVVLGLDDDETGNGVALVERLARAVEVQLDLDGHSRNFFVSRISAFSYL